MLTRLPLVAKSFQVPPAPADPIIGDLEIVSPTGPLDSSAALEVWDDFKENIEPLAGKKDAKAGGRKDFQSPAKDDASIFSPIGEAKTWAAGPGVRRDKKRTAAVKLF